MKTANRVHLLPANISGDVLTYKCTGIMMRKATSGYPGLEFLYLGKTDFQTEEEGFEFNAYKQASY
ncbi:MAG: hypothetical protein ACLTDV_06395 [Eubacterium sp.]